jgi:hypothetical protein
MLTQTPSAEGEKRARKKKFRVVFGPVTCLWSSPHIYTCPFHSNIVIKIIDAGLEGVRWTSLSDHEDFPLPPVSHHYPSVSELLGPPKLYHNTH